MSTQARTADFSTVKDATADVPAFRDAVGAILQGLAPYFYSKSVDSSLPPSEVLQGLILGLAGATDRNSWKIQTASNGDLLLQRNTGTEETPVWTTRMTFASAGGLSSGLSIVNSDVAGGAAIDRNKINGNVDNLLVNAGFKFWQDGTTRDAATAYPNNDDVYVADQWILLSDGNDIVDVSREASVVPDGARYAMKLDVETGDKKFGIFQPIERLTAQELRAKNLCLSFDARITGTSIGAIKARVVYWDGSGDNITSDIVSAWGDAGEDPTLVANWTYITPSGSVNNPDPTTTYQRYTFDISLIPATANNIGVFIWVDDVTLTVGDFLYIANPMLHIGSASVQFARTPVARDLADCLRFYEKTFSLATAPADGLNDFSGALRLHCVTTVAVPALTWLYKVPKRISPTVTLYNPKTAGTAGQWTDGTTDLADARSIQGNEQGVGIDNTTTAVASTNQFFIHAKADCRL